ncbi:MAG: DUF547 domain-containing protein [Kiritimatiellae bacterium]|nr:DUF547 domain-containing protein [Kiritimatiellia bacterium]MDW8458512.1 DUF547 domain-containing protein [Verrucomicrobiota bacterium]
MNILSLACVGAGLLFILAAQSPAADIDDPLAAANAIYAELLANHVKDGRVDYRGLRARRDQIQECLKMYGSIRLSRFDRWTIPERLAFLSNLYNLYVLKIILDDYPLSSIRKAGGWFSGDPFEWKVVSIFGHRTSLLIIHKNYLRRDYAEPGIHFAVCQGARSSPPLRHEPYNGEHYYDQIADQARVFLSRAPDNQIDVKRRRMVLSPIFKWYEEDFARYAGGVEGYIRIIAPPEWGVRDAPGRFSVSYSRFDWKLNDANPGRK